MNIVITSLLLIAVTLIMAKLYKQRIRIKTFLILALSSIVITAISLIVAFGGNSGTQYRIIRGWPHFFHVTNYIENDVVINTFAFGPGGSYVLSNILFYFALTLFLHVIFFKLYTKFVKPTLPAIVEPPSL
ncbi:MAG: hypothetical protein M3Q73_04395 [bacterium]|nr:hypothetical protein [bacterium]